jgi:hypothetical protein
MLKITKMSDLIPQPKHNTKAQTFIAKRGALVMKEISSIGLLTGKYNSKVGIDAFIFTVMKVAQIDRTRGIMVTVKTDNDGLQTCLIDEDELPELVNGINYLDEKLRQLSHCVPTQIELAYLTKDDFMIGFVQKSDPNPNPSFFCSARGGESAFVPAEQLPQLKALIEKGIDYLKSISAS